MRPIRRSTVGLVELPFFFLVSPPSLYVYLAAAGLAGFAWGLVLRFLRHAAHNDAQRWRVR